VTGQVHYSTVSTAGEVHQILRLQAENLASALAPETLLSQGFVTVQHDPDVLRRMNAVAPAIIAKASELVVGYALVMPREFAPFVPILGPLFDMLDGLSWRGTPLRDNARWFVMGQICIAKQYRGTGIFDGLYRAMGAAYRDRYDFTITEVAARNTRSLAAHARVGFQTICIYPDAMTGEQWHVLGLDFDAPART
jgi:GNAT superfamily N-acetyltransferase